MKSPIVSLAFAVWALLSPSPGLRAESLPPAYQVRVDEQIQAILAWAADPVIVAAVCAHNAGLPADQDGLTQEKWAGLPALDPLVHSFTRNPAGLFLKTKRNEFVVEAFLSDASGRKVAFIGKPTNWSHAGKPKHMVPMTGTTWQGPLQLDESTSQRQIQVAVPVREAGVVIGSLVVGLSISNLLM